MEANTSSQIGGWLACGKLFLYPAVYPFVEAVAVGEIFLISDLHELNEPAPRVVYSAKQALPTKQINPQTAVTKHAVGSQAI